VVRVSVPGSCPFLFLGTSSWLFFFMTMENLCVRFNGKNYAAWEFQFKMFVKGKGIWGHVDGSSSKPTTMAELAAWETLDAQSISWLLGSIEPLMVNNMRSFSTAKDMWDYLNSIFNQDHSAKRFQLELDSQLQSG